jgi:hypothetical protein
VSEPAQSHDFWLTIFLPAGITWECADGAIRTRRTSTGEIVMPTRKCSGPAQSWLSAVRNIEPRGQCTPLDGVGHRVVVLSPTEEAEYERLYKQRSIVQDKLRVLTVAARTAVQARNLMKKEQKRIQKLWLPLAERKYPQ